MNYKLEKFSGFNKRDNKSFVSITRAKAIGLSSAFCEEHNVEDYRYAVLFYDRDRNAVGFKLTNDKTEKSKFAITRSNKHKGKTSSIVAGTFFSKYKIPVDRYAHKYPFLKISARDLGFDEAGSVFVFDLKESQPELE